MDKDNSFDIAIIGMSCRVPDAGNLDEFWDNLKQGRESIQFFTTEEMAREGEVSFTKSNYVNAGGILEEIEEFDNTFFDMSSSEADISDPQHLIFLEAVWNALEDSGNIPGRYPGIIGMFGSSSTNTYLYRNLLPNRGLMDKLGIHPLLIGNEKDFLSTRVSYKLGLTGPSMTVQTACSSSLVAVHMAIQSLLNGECTMAAAGGVTVRSSQRVGYEFSEGGILSPDGICRAFDENANGTVTGNGVGVVILKRYEDAVREGDSIYAVIKSSAVRNDGLHKVGFTAPGVEGQIQTIRDAINLSGVRPEDISYVEAHGTGTRLGDPVELSALCQVYAEYTDHKAFCALGSVKSSIGHLDVAAGVVGLIKVAMMLRNRRMVPTVNFLSPNPELNLEKSPFYINTECEEWESEGNRFAGVSSFGLGGTNCHIILEEYVPERMKGKERPLYLVPLSAKTETSLISYTDKLLNQLKKNGYPLADVACTLATGRKLFKYRRAIVCGNLEELKTKLGSTTEITKSPARTLPLTLLVSDMDFEMLDKLYPHISDCGGSFAGSLLASTDILSRYGLTCNDLLDCAAGRICTKQPAWLTKQAAGRTASYICNLSLLSGIITEFGLMPNTYAYTDDGHYAIKVLLGQIGAEDVLDILLEDPASSGRGTDADIKSAIELYDGNHRAGHLLHIGCMELNKEAADQVHQIAGIQEDDVSEYSLFQSIMETVGALWCSGIAIDWEKYYEGLEAKRVSLATYSFERTRHWIEAKPQTGPGITVSNEAGGRSPEEVTSRLVEIWRRHLPVEQINMDTDFFMAGGDSFRAIQIQSQISQEFGVQLSLSRFIAEPTLGTQVQQLLSKLKGGDVQPAETGEPDERVVRLRIGDDAHPPVFLIHPAGGTVMVYKALVQELNCNRNIFAIQVGMPAERAGEKKECIEETAAEYIKLIKRLYPQGPYLLGGHSYGGNVAFEMSLQLQRTGDSVEELLLFDSHPPKAYFNNMVMTDEKFLEAFPIIASLYFPNDNIGEDVGAPSVRVITQPREDIAGIVGYLKKYSTQLSLLPDEEIMHFFQVWVSNHNALRTHNPQEMYNGRLHFFQAQQPQPREILEILNINLQHGMDLAEWGRLSADFCVYPIPGTHYSMLNEPNVQIMARSLEGIV
ncbi:type I polyketide synthase [Paenibacillus sp. FSL R7-0179]|uniref:type I polyketide synthase n=1 Tax=Paenibacillus sp. FSL R7-0179 TaxID=2921672 RepID=UPI0030F8AAE6